MESIVIHPENEDQLKAIKAFLKTLKVRFDKQKPLPQHVILSVKKGLEEYEKGEHISFEHFKKKHFLGDNA